jgi:hypothetical protein
MSTLSNPNLRDTLIRAKTDLDTTIHALAKLMGLDIRNVNLKYVTELWCDQDGNNLISGTPNEYFYQRLETLCQRRQRIVEMLEGPNRIL